jgi:hypothetical protein
MFVYLPSCYSTLFRELSAATFRLLAESFAVSFKLDTELLVPFFKSPRESKLSVEVLEPASLKMEVRLSALEAKLSLLAVAALAKLSTELVKV